MSITTKRSNGECSGVSFISSSPSEYSIQPQNTPTGFHDLPRNVLINIFAHFSEKDISLRLIPVCRNWRRAAQDHSLWRHLEFFGNNVSSSFICRKLRNSPLLETAKFISVPDVITVVRQLCRCNVRLKSLVLKYCTDNLRDERLPDAVLRNIVSSCQELRNLDLKGTQFHTHRFVHDLLRLPQLKSLNLSHNRYLRARDLVTVSLNCRELEELKLSRLRVREGQPVITDADASFIFENLRETLVSVVFDARGLGPITFQALLNCSKLHRLCLNNALLLSGDLFQSIAKHLRYIRVLKVGNAAQLTSTDFINLFSHNEEVMKHLTSLDVSGCWKLGAEGLKAVADVCGRNLEFLNLRGCKSITTQCLGYVLSKCQKLGHLDIAHTTQIDEKALHEIQLHLPHLQTLIIDEDKKKEDTIVALKSKMPSLKISLSISELSKRMEVVA